MRVNKKSSKQACVHEPIKCVNKLREGLVKVINRTKHTGTD